MSASDNGNGGRIPVAPTQYSDQNLNNGDAKRNLTDHSQLIIVAKAVVECLQVGMIELSNRPSEPIMHDETCILYRLRERLEIASYFETRKLNLEVQNDLSNKLMTVPGKLSTLVARQKAALRPNAQPHLLRHTAELAVDLANLCVGILNKLQHYQSLVEEDKASSVFRTDYWA